MCFLVELNHPSRLTRLRRLHCAVSLCCIGSHFRTIRVMAVACRECLRIHFVSCPVVKGNETLRSEPCPLLANSGVGGKAEAGAPGSVAKGIRQREGGECQSSCIFTWKISELVFRSDVHMAVSWTAALFGCLVICERVLLVAI